MPKADIGAKAKGTSNKIGTSKLVESLATAEKQRNDSLLNLNRNLSKSNNTVIPIMPTKGSSSRDKSTTIDDYGIAFTNSLVFGS